jgi:parvulin-like peptidyl-prolyl isomerase
MLSWIREKFGKAMISVIIGFIAFVFVFYGFFSPKATRGLQEGAVAGTVNGDSISIPEFNREFNREIEIYKNLAGGKLTDDQIKAFKLKEGVFRELVKQKLLSQESKRLGLFAADEQIKEKIQEIPVFQKEGKFDLASYHEVLAANHYTPAAFERMMGGDLAIQKWPSFFKKRIRVSDQEIRNEFEMRQDQRNIKYVLLDHETGKKALQVDEAEIKKFLADPARLSSAQAKFEQGKSSIYKEQKFESVQDGIVRDILLGEKLTEIQKTQETMAEAVLGKFAGKAPSDLEVNQVLKPVSVQVKSTGLISRQSNMLPGIGPAQEILADAFSAKSPIDLSAGGQAKRYNLSGRVLIAWVTESKKANWDEFSAQREILMGEMSNRKFANFFDGWIKGLGERSKVEPNPAVVSAE